MSGVADAWAPVGGALAMGRINDFGAVVVDRAIGRGAARSYSRVIRKPSQKRGDGIMAKYETYEARADVRRAEAIAATTSPFMIEVRFVGGLSDNQQAAFAAAADRWARM